MKLFNTFAVTLLTLPSAALTASVEDVSFVSLTSIAEPESVDGTIVTFRLP